MNDLENQRSHQVLSKLKEGNAIYVNACSNSANISIERRIENVRKGQEPYAVVVSCSDSRVPPEHIFTAGIGDLFVVRTAGNVVGAFELGSIEYAVKYLHVPVIVIMGHTHCGAVAAALHGEPGGYINNIVSEIRYGLDGAETEKEAIFYNTNNSKRRIMQSEIVKELVEANQLIVVCAEYDIESGHVRFY